MKVNEGKMIPKIIHYCWFGEGEKDSKTLECIATWKKYLPDYQIKEWSNKDLALVNNQYVTEAFQAKKWAFVSDYFRLYALYQRPMQPVRFFLPSECRCLPTVPSSTIL